MDRLTPKPLPDGAAPAKEKLHEYMPPALQKEWQAWFDRFVKHYGLNEEQREQAKAKFETSENQTVSWILSSKKPIAKISPYGPPAVAEKTIRERIEEADNLTKQAQDIETSELRHSHDDLTRAEINTLIRNLKADANRIRSELRADLNRQTTDMREAVGAVLDEKQVDKPRLSSSMKVGSVARARAISRRRRSPPESATAGMVRRFKGK